MSDIGNGYDLIKRITSEKGLLEENLREIDLTDINNEEKRIRLKIIGDFLEDSNLLLRDFGAL